MPFHDAPLQHPMMGCVCSLRGMFFRAMERWAAGAAVLAVAGCFTEASSSTTSASESGSATSGAATTTVSATVAPSDSTGTSTPTDPTDGSTTDSNADSSSDPTLEPTDPTSDPGPCERGERYVAPVPPGWNPEIYFLMIGADDEDPAPCPGTLEVSGVVLEEPEAGACTCDCNPGCWVDVYSDDQCGDLFDIFAAHDSDCTPLVPDDEAAPVTATLAPDDLAMDDECNGPRASGSIVSSGRHRVCRHVEGNECVPKPELPLVGPCVAIDNWLPEQCPEGPYAVRYQVATDATPNCGPCPSCIAEAESACGNAAGTMFADTGCGIQVSPQDSLCSPMPGRAIELSVGLECPSADAASPSIDGSRTFCCMP